MFSFGWCTRPVTRNVAPRCLEREIGISDHSISIVVLVAKIVIVHLLLGLANIPTCGHPKPTRPAAVSAPPPPPRGRASRAKQIRTLDRLQVGEPLVGDGDPLVAVYIVTVPVIVSVGGKHSPIRFPDKHVELHPFLLFVCCGVVTGTVVVAVAVAAKRRHLHHFAGAPIKVQRGGRRLARRISYVDPLVSTCCSRRFR
jgi:hypothetical protein